LIRVAHAGAGVADAAERGVATHRYLGSGWWFNACTTANQTIGRFFWAC